MDALAEVGKRNDGPETADGPRPTPTAHEEAERLFCSLLVSAGEYDAQAFRLPHPIHHPAGERREGFFVLRCNTTNDPPQGGW